MKTPEILYNLGLSKLHLKKSKEAFDCLLVSLRIYHNNPRLWLRIAEACIINHKSQKEAQLQEHNTYKGKQCKLSKAHKIFYESNNASSRAIPAPTIEFASFCLSNCLRILKDYQSENCCENDIDNLNVVRYGICNPSSHFTKEDFNKILACAYLNSSYVALELGDYVLALKYSKDLIRLEKIPISYM